MSVVYRVFSQVLLSGKVSFTKMVNEESEFYMEQ